MTEQKYSFADVFISFKENDESNKIVPPQRVTVALKSFETLGFKEDDYSDKQIFFYFNNYEQLLEYLAYGYNVAEWKIIGIIGLYEEL